MNSTKTPDEKMLDCALKILKEEIKLKPDQPLRITSDSKYLPFVRLLVEKAYDEMKSGWISVKLVEPELEALKKKHGITEEFKYREKTIEELKEKGAAFITFDNNSSPYAKAGLTAQETQQAVESITPKIPEQVQKALNIDPKEILQGNLSLRPGQPLLITGSREHMPQILQLAEYAYKHGTKLLDVSIYENKENDLSIPYYKYASESLLETVPQSTADRYQEYLDTNTARLFLEGDDPTLYEGLDPSRITKSQVAIGKKIKPIREQMVFRNPWNIYYLPTTASAIAAYTEHGTDSIAALRQAAEDARKINRVGNNEEHLKKLAKLADTMNELRQKGFNTIHFVSVDQISRQPDGKTDLKIGLSDKALFCAATESTPTGQLFVANTPTEEVFTTPDAEKTNGIVSATMPLNLNGTLIEGIKMEFKDGRIAKDQNGELKISATKNEQMLKEHISQHENADKLGEVALVAGSPIFDLGRVFKNTLIDENAACHIAIGSGYSMCIKGANEISDQNRQKEYLNQYHCNDSTTHNDFMIGGPDVTVFAEKEDGSQIVLIQDNQFKV